MVNIDVTVIKDRYHGDTSKMFFVGEPSVMARRLVEITQECLYRGIQVVRPGAHLGDIGHAIQSHAEANNLSVVREFCGHGIGDVFHDEPQMLHYGRPNTGAKIEAGMTFTIEPMINAGQRHIKMLPDQWTVVTKDHKLSAQWEHTILVTRDGAEVLTRRAEEQLSVTPTDKLSEARRRISSSDSLLAQRFWAGEDIETIVRSRAAFFDELIKDLWSRIKWPEGTGQHLALFAVGGYGRGELHPHSDIDLLILVDGDPAEYRDGIETFVQNLWDLKLNIGHSVRTIDQCHQEAKEDIATATSILERRLLAGTLALDRQVGRLFATDEIWPSARFFSAKVDEQRKRHDRYQDVDYNLEPNIKVAPGGLRDIQTVGWIIKRHFGNTSADDLTARGFLTAQERQWLNDGRRFLWRVRYGLHLVAGRSEDRLLFDYQRTLADRLGYTDSDAQLGVEQFMHDYYSHVLSLREVNDILLQHFDEAILRAHYEPEIEPINERFQIRDNYIETRSEDVFRTHPPALMEMFVIMANRRDISGVRATTIRQVRNSLDLIDEAFRNNPEVTGLFIDLLRAPYTLVSQLTRMRRYGMLSRYIPEFGRVIGQMQHDLFHIYTVDAHTMMVIRNMRRLHYRSSQDTFPVAHHCIKNLPKIELLYIAGLFHDIAKGRGGDHSTLGAVDVIDFCRRHRTRRCRHRVGGVARARASADVRHRAEQGHQRSGRDPRIRERSAHRNAARLSVHAHRRRHQRDQSDTCGTAGARR